MSMDSKHILLVDDEADFRLAMALLLERLGYQVSEANNGLHALSVINSCLRENRHIDLIITDIKMPMMTGLELIDSLRKQQLPVDIVVITGYGNRESMSELTNRGCNKILHKPFDEEELLLLLDHFFSGADHVADNCK